MPAMPPPVADERAGLREFLAAQQHAFRAVAFGLTDDQARATPTVGTLSIGGLIKHATACQDGWMRQVAAAPDAPAPDTRSPEQQEAARVEEFTMGPQETLADVLARFEEQNAITLALVDETDLATAVPVPRDAPYFPPDIDAWSVRWVILHLIEELARHAGHADIIRESIDGATLFELVAALEGWPASSWLTPWGAEPVEG